MGPQKVRGELTAPRSKAYTHRAFLAALLSRGESVIRNPLRCDDTARTLSAIQALGAEVHHSKEKVAISGVGKLFRPTDRIYCGESGATFRFVMAVSTAGLNRAILTASEGLSSRPILPLVTALRELGASVQLQPTDKALAVTVKGPLTGGQITIPGDVSSQFVSGLLLAAPLATSDVKIVVKGRMESQPYVQLTMAVLGKHGIKTVWKDNELSIPAPQQYQPAIHSVPADFSSVAFLLAAATTAGEEIAIQDVNGFSALEPDSIIIELLQKVGGDVKMESERILAARGELNGFEFDASDHPDLVPVLEVLACAAEGRSRIQGIRRLSYKESDRLRTIPEELGKMGATIHVTEDEVIVEGGQRLVGYEVSSHRDHRVAMACTIASLAARGQSLITDAGVISKSYPEFYNDLVKLGVHLDVE